MAKKQAQSSSSLTTGGESAKTSDGGGGRGGEGGKDSSPHSAPLDKSTKSLTLDSIFDSRDFKAESYSQPRWWREGSQYTTLDRIQGGGIAGGGSKTPSKKSGGGDLGRRQPKKKRKDRGAGKGAAAADPKGKDDEDDDDNVAASSTSASASTSAQPPPRDILWHDASTGTSTVFVSHALLIPPGQSDPLPVDDYAFSNDKSRLLVFTNARKVWRKKTRGDYWVLDITARELRPLGGKKAEGTSSLMFATFSPDGRKIAYVRERNLYVQDLRTFDIAQLTFDGTADDYGDGDGRNGKHGSGQGGGGVINGTFDWAYEEEFSLRRGFRWSTDSKKIAFWRIDQSGVRCAKLVNGADYLYPKVTFVPYPKTGERNAECKVGLVTLPTNEEEEDAKVEDATEEEEAPGRALGSDGSDGSGNDVVASASGSRKSRGPPRHRDRPPRTVWLSLPGSARDHYVADLDWIESTGELYLQRLNRLQNEVKLYVCDDLESGKTSVMFEDADDCWLDLQRPLKWLGKDGRTFLWLSERGGWRQLYVVERAGRASASGGGDGGDDAEDDGDNKGGSKKAKMTALTAPTYDVCSVCGVDEERGWVYYVASPDDPLRRYLYRTKLSPSGDGRQNFTSAERVTPLSMSGTNSYVLSSDGRYAIHVRSTFERPETTSIVRLPDHSVRLTLADNERIRERLEDMTIASSTTTDGNGGNILPRAEFFRVTIKTKKEGAEGGGAQQRRQKDDDNEGGSSGDDGHSDDSDSAEPTTTATVQLDAYALHPPDFDPSKKYPVLLYVYGEPAMQVVRDAWTGRNGLWHRMLAQRGYIVMSVDNRGTPAPRGRAWRKCVYKRIGILASEDQARAVEALLEERPYLDRERVAVWGWSGGGSMSLNAIFRYPDLYGTAMAVAPVPNQRGYDTIYQERYMSLPSDNVDGYRDGSPITHAHRLRGNLLIVHGTGDDNCHYGGTEALVDELIRHGKHTFQMMAYPNRSHSISEGKGTTRHLFGLLTDFLGRHVPAGDR